MELSERGAREGIRDTISRYTWRGIELEGKRRRVSADGALRVSRMGPLE